MAKIIDITDKLKFEENPKLVIKGEEFEVNTDAATVIEIIGGGGVLLDYRQAWSGSPGRSRGRHDPPRQPEIGRAHV